MNWGGLPLEVEEDDAKQAADRIKKMKWITQLMRWDEMQWCRDGKR